MQPLVLGSVVINVLVSLVGVVLLVVGFKSYTFGRIVRDTPTAKPSSVAAGRAEVEGIARPVDEPIEAPFLDESALCLDWKLEEQVSEDGENEKWVERATETRLEPFYLEDDHGRVLVRADKHPNPEDLPWEYESRRFKESESAEVETFLRQHRKEGENPAVAENPAVTENPATTSRPDGDAVDSVRWRYVVRLLPPEKRLYVFGSLEPQYGYSDIGFETDETTGQFVINNTNEKWTAAEAYWIGLLALGSGFLFVLWGGSIAIGPLAELTPFQSSSLIASGIPSLFSSP